MTMHLNRIAFLVRRDGYEQARRWVERTLAIYLEAEKTPSSHVSKPEFRRQVEAEMEEFRTWLNKATPAKPLGQFKD